MEVGLKLSKARVSGEGHFKWMSFLSYWTSTRNAGVLSPRPRVGPVLLQFCASRKQHSARCYTPLCSMRRHEIVGDCEVSFFYSFGSYDSNHRQRPAWKHNTTGRPQASSPKLLQFEQPANSTCFPTKLATSTYYQMYCQISTADLAHLPAGQR